MPADGVRPESGSYAERFRRSAVVFERARKILAGLATHDSRMLDPFPVAVDRADGPWKWTVDGVRLADYWMGHGALLFGHGFPPVLDALVRQAAMATHAGAASEAEVEWAELVAELIPSAERVRFTSSGTEATMLAARVARAFTGRPWILKLDGHFHGWHDEALAHFVPVSAAGLAPHVTSSVALAGPLDIAPIERALETRCVAGVILEPGGGSGGALPWSTDFLRSLREMSQAAGTLLIFDEVVSGFRYAPGGVQQLSGVTPDLTTLAKILCGGLPGGAVVGRADVMGTFGGGTVIGERAARVPHSGTFNANPLAAAAGIAMLQHVKDGVAQETARTAAESLAAEMNRLAEARRVDIAAFTSSSILHLVVGARRQDLPANPSAEIVMLYKTNPGPYAVLRRALLLEGVDTHAFHAWVSTEHRGEAFQATIDAFDRAFMRLHEEPGFPL